MQATTRARPKKAPGTRRKSRVGPRDFDARLYPLMQREAAAKDPANYWDVRLSSEDAQALSLHLAARFAFDSLEHLALEDPRLGKGFLANLTVIASIDEETKPGNISVTASFLEPPELTARRARATVTNRGVATNAAPPPVPTFFPGKPVINPSSKGETMGIRSFLSSLANPQDSAGASAQERWATPDSILQNTLAEIDNKAMDWPDGKDLPDCVTIYLSQTDYARYGPRKSASEQHVAAKILDYAQECGALLERNPHVSIKVDPLLYCGQMRIDASFTDPASNNPPARGNAATRPLSTANVAGAGAASGVRAATNSARFASEIPLPFPKSNPHATPEFQTAAAASTPVYGSSASKASAIAKLTGPTFQSAVLPDDTVGRIRYRDRPKPTIALDGADFEFVSQRQGFFEHDRNGWWFTSTGRNGTSVQRKGSWTKLPDNQRFNLEDGDSISFGKCTPLTFSIAQ